MSGVDLGCSVLNVRIMFYRIYWNKEEEPPSEGLGCAEEEVGPTNSWDSRGTQKLTRAQSKRYIRSIYSIRWSSGSAASTSREGGKACRRQGRRVTM